MNKCYGYVRMLHAQPYTEDELSSLSICKPNIRRTANIGDIIIGYKGGSSLSDTPMLSFIGIVADKIPMECYMGDPAYFHRKDNLYNAQKERTKCVSNYDKKHWNYGGLTEKQVIDRDWRGEYILFFQNMMDIERDVYVTTDELRFNNLISDVMAHPEYPHFKSGDKKRLNHRTFYL